VAAERRVVVVVEPFSVPTVTDFSTKLPKTKGPVPTPRLQFWA